MDSRKLERILIAIALLLNLFLLSVVLLDSVQARRSARETAASLTALLEESGIAAEPGAVALRAAPQGYTLVRDMAAEQRIVTKLIGKTAPSDQGGNILFYAGEKGQAQCRGSGETDVLFEPGAVPLQRNMQRAAARVLRRAGLSVAPAASAAGKDETDFYCTLDGYPVYNAVLHLDTLDGSAYMLTGTRIFDAATAAESDGLLDSVTVLIRFLEIVRAEGYICSRVVSVEPGYLQSVTRSGEAELAPVWRIVTDTGTLMIDAESGKAVDRLS